VNRYGKELIFDMRDCDPNTFSRDVIGSFFVALADVLKVERGDVHYWDDTGTPQEEKETEPRLRGTSAVQFIRTSNITVHTLDVLKRVYLNVFSCDEFDSDLVVDIAKRWFCGNVVNRVEVTRV